MSSFLRKKMKQDQGSKYRNDVNKFQVLKKKNNQKIKNLLTFRTILTPYQTILLFALPPLPPKNKLNYETLSHLQNIKGLTFN